MLANQLKHAANLEDWKQRIMVCRASGLTVRQWCAQNHLNTSTYYRWEREVFRGIKSSADNADEPCSALAPISDQTLVELPIAPAADPVAPAKEPISKQTFCPVAVVRVGDMELSVTNAVSQRLMRQLKELLPYAEGR